MKNSLFSIVAITAATRNGASAGAELSRRPIAKMRYFWPALRAKELKER
jgi:hypothetical protein